MEETDDERLERYAYYKRRFGFDEEALEDCRQLDIEAARKRSLVDPAIGACRNCGLALHLPPPDGCRRMVNCDAQRSGE